MSELEINELEMSWQEKQKLAKLELEENLVRLTKEWVEKNISEAIFEFYCGGDSMGDTTLIIYDETGNEINDKELSVGYYEILEDIVYDRVEFYEASDGHYMGESGKVHILYDEETESLVFNKDSESEFNEMLDATIDFVLTDDEYDYLNNYVSSFFSSNWEGDNFNYKKDFILTDEIKVKERKLMDNIHDAIGNEEYDIPDNGEINDEGISFSSVEGFRDGETENVLNISKKNIDDKIVNVIRLYYSVEYTIFFTD